MLRQISQLSGIQLINLFGINEMRHTRNRKKKARYIGLGVMWGMLAMLLIFYVAILSVGLIKFGMAEMIPMYLFFVTGFFILFFTLFKAGSVIFQMNTYELLVSLPVSQTAIVVSRFLTLYVTNLLLSMSVMFPGMAVYGIFVRPSASFYVYGLVGTLFLPLLPLTIATGLGAAITAISSRMRHKSLAAAFLSILLCMIFLVSSMGISGNAEALTAEQMKNITAAVTEQIGGIYPPAVWFGEAAVQGNATGFLLFVGGSIVVFVVLVAVLQKYFVSICTAIGAASAKNNYQMKSLHTSSVRAALWKREMKRYFASSIYVTNTLMGYLLMLVLGIGLFIAGPEKIEEMLGLPGIVSGGLPVALAWTAAIMPTSACSVSMEGKQWWIAQTLPIKSRDIWDSKILVNLTLALPFYVLAVLFGILAVKPTVWQGIWIVVIPFVYILFTSVAGITINLAMPLLQWENETRVVKQSASTMVALLVGFVSVIPPAVGVFALGKEAQNAVYGATTAILLGMTIVLYLKNAKKSVIL